MSGHRARAAAPSSESTGRRSVMAPLQLQTGRWRDAWLASQEDCALDFVPVRISLGVPKYWPGARDLASVPELAPPYRLLAAKVDRRAFEDAYLEHLDRVGADLIETRLNAIAGWDGSGLPLRLLCFENLADPAAWCHRTMWARWWHERTGQAVAELAGQPAHNARHVSSGHLPVPGMENR